MNRHLRHISDLAVIAEDTIGASSAKLAASIVLNNKIVSIGVNSYKTHPFQKKYGKNDMAICIHSEIAAIGKALKRISIDELRRATLYIARVKQIDQSSQWGLARPCKGCQRAIAAFDIKKVYYTTDEHRRYECL